MTTKWTLQYIEYAYVFIVFCDVVVIPCVLVYSYVLFTYGPFY